MIISNEFTVGADADTVWRHLLDMEGVASCLPGASIEPTEEEDTYNGSMRVRIGPMTVDYKGTAKLAEVDEAGRTATISLRAREARGQGTAMATIRNRLEPADGGTRVLAETDLHITGPQAQFGRGVMEDVGGRVLGEFSSRLERKIAGEGEPDADQDAPASAGAAPAGDRDGEDEALDLGALLSESVVGRYARAAAAAVVVVLLLLVLVGGRRR
ncbi:MAG: carbon monoxide dehydrogenase [Solirubrobacterales bacterium]|nr:carbon monoxide dehydrogenase [Solirubrobacterales bacterium]